MGHATTALIVMLFFALAELFLFILLTASYFRVLSDCGPVSDGREVSLEQKQQNEAFDELRKIFTKMIYSCLAISIVMNISVGVNTFLCCCTSGRRYYGVLTATGLIIIVGTIVMVSLGIGAADLPESFKNSPYYQSHDARLSISRIQEMVQIAFWIILALNSSLGLWILSLGVSKFLSAMNAESDDKMPLIPVSLAPEPRPHAETPAEVQAFSFPNPIQGMPGG